MRLFCLFIKAQIRTVLLLLLFGCLLSLFSCKKANDPEIVSVPEPTQPLPSVPSGLIIDSTSVKVNITKFGGGKYFHSNWGITKFPLDLDGDKTDDIEFVHNYATGGYGVYTCSMSINSLDDSVDVCVDSVFQMQAGGGSAYFHSYTRHELFSRRFNYGDTIKPNLKWKSGPFLFFDYSDHWVGTGNSGHMEFSISAMDPGEYISFRCHRKLGWMKAVVYNSRTIVLLEFAIEK